MKVEDQPVVGLNELAELLGVQERTPQMWQYRNVLPPADMVVNGRPAWLAVTIIRWAVGLSPCSNRVRIHGDRLYLVGLLNDKERAALARKGII